MKILKKLIYTIFIFVFLISYAKATDYNYGRVNSDIGIIIRSGPGTSYSQLSTGLDNGVLVKILEISATNDNSTGCASGNWYKIEYNKVSSGIGYACANFVDLIELENDDAFEATLLTFPESYRDKLRLLHAIYPNASFIAYNTGLDWYDVVSNESPLGKSLIWDSNGSRDGLKSLDSYIYSSNSFSTNYGGGGSTWYAASSDTISYYLDPRNFLNENRVFMFESLSFNSSYHTLEGIESILKSSFMYNTSVDNSSEKFSDVIMEAGKTYGISPYYIGSRILQETGTTRSALVKGTYDSYPQFNGYYNFFNYGAGGTNVVYNGLSYAYNSGWNSEKKAIIGGSGLIGTSYIGVGQDTGYFQKWDTICKSNFSSNWTSCKYYTHQYMQNIEAPYSEGYTTYKAYGDNLGTNMYMASYIFKIPVYNNMPTITYLPSSSNPINYLSKLWVNGSSVNNFDYLTNDYYLNLPAGTLSINVDALAIASSKGATVSGSGTINITSNSQDVPITVKAANGSTNIYTIHVMRAKSSNNNLTSIKINNEVCSLSSGQQFCSLTLSSSVSGAIVSAILSDSTAKIVTDLSKTFELKYGINNIEIKVEAEDGSIKTYTVAITRNGDGTLSNNNNLKSISINNNSLDVVINKEFYEQTVSDSTSSVVINALIADENAKLLTDLSRAFNLVYGTNNVEIKVEAEDGSIKTYTLSINRTKGINYTVDNLSSGRVNNNFISGLTNYNTIINAISSANNEASVEITDLKGNLVTDGSIGTGYKVKLSSNGDIKTFDAIIYGDTNGDASIDVIDLLRVQKLLLNSVTLTTSQKEACDLNKDGKIDILDLLLVKKYLLGISQINQ